MSYLQAIETGEDVLRIEPPRATLGQLQLTNRLEMVRVDDDVLGVAKALKRIDAGLTLLHDLKQKVFVLYWIGVREVDGRVEVVEDLVGAYTELDQRIVSLIERLDAQGRGRYDLVRELDRLDTERKREQDAAFSERIGDSAERLAHALRQDLQSGNRAYVGGPHKGSRGKPKAKKRRR